jgi:hypothetical protein
VSNYRAEDERAIELAASDVADMLEDDSWMHRIVEGIEFADEARMQRRLSLDFTVPRTAHGICITDGEVHVPLLTLEKTVIKALSLTDGEGKVIPVLTSRENGILSTAVLVEQARRTGLSISCEGRKLLRDLANGRSVQSDAEYEQRKQEAVLTEEDRRIVAALEALQSTSIRQLTNSFLLVGRVRARPGDRIVVKLSYEEEISLTGGYLVLQTPGLFRSDTYHVEIVAPEDTVIADSNLQVFARVPDGGHGARLRRHWIDRNRNVDRSHLYGRRASVPADVAAAAEKEALVLVWVRSRPWVVEPLMMVSMLITAVFVLGGLAFRAGLTEDPATAAATVVVLPALAAGYFASSGHRLSQKLRRGVQLSAYTCAGNSLGAAGALLLKPRGHDWTMPHLSFLGLLLSGLAAILWSTLIREIVSARFIVLNEPGDGSAPGKWRKRLQEPQWWKWLAALSTALALACLWLAVGPTTPRSSRQAREWLWLGFLISSIATTSYLALAWQRALYNSRNPADNKATIPL